MPQDVKGKWILSAAIIMKIEVTFTNNIAKFIQNKNDNKNTSLIITMMMMMINHVYV
jgi:hypothetical protein